MFVICVLQEICISLDFWAGFESSVLQVVLETLLSWETGVQWLVQDLHPFSASRLAFFCAGNDMTYVPRKNEQGLACLRRFGLVFATSYCGCRHGSDWRD